MKIIVILEAVFGIYAAVYCFLYYTGKLKYKGEKEEKRKRIVQKHGHIFLFAGIILMIYSLEVSETRP